MIRLICARCPVEIPADRRLCYFHVRSEELTSKECLRCHRALSLDSFASNGRFRICDECRWSHNMTAEETAESKRLSRNASQRRHLRTRRLTDRAYQQRRAA